MGNIKALESEKFELETITAKHKLLTFSASVSNLLNNTVFHGIVEVGHIVMSVLVLYSLLILYA